jgi:hypothetical protein
MTFSSRLSRSQLFAVAGLIFAVAVFRVLSATWLPGLPNFSPVMALAFCGGLFLPGVFAWLLPIAVILVSDMGLALANGYPVFGSWQIVSLVCLAVAVGAGRWLARRETFGLGAFVGLLLASSVGFYLVSNAGAWLVEPLYPQTVAGFIQAQTIGLPGFPPSWMFLRNALISDLLFGGMILGVRFLARRSDVEFAQSLNVEVGNHPRPAAGVQKA